MLVRVVGPAALSTIAMGHKMNYNKISSGGITVRKRAIRTRVRVRVRVCARAHDIIIVDSQSPRCAKVLSGFSDHAFFLDFCVSRISSSIISFIVNSGHGSCAARLGAPVWGAQEIANFGLESCAVLTETQGPGPRAKICADRTGNWLQNGPNGASFCAGRTGSATLSNHTENWLKSCEN